VPTPLDPEGDGAVLLLRIKDGRRPIILKPAHDLRTVRYARQRSEARLAALSG